MQGFFSEISNIYAFLQNILKNKKNISEDLIFA